MAGAGCGEFLRQESTRCPDRRRKSVGQPPGLCFGSNQANQFLPMLRTQFSVNARIGDDLDLARQHADIDQDRSPIVVDVHAMGHKLRHRRPVRCVRGNSVWHNAVAYSRR